MTDSKQERLAFKRTVEGAEKKKAVSQRALMFLPSPTVSDIPIS